MNRTDSSCGSLQRSFTRGLDVAGSTTATGGVGALLQITDQVNGKTNEVALLGEWLLTYWSDHAVTQMHVVNLEQVED